MQLQGTSIIGAEPVVSAGKTFTAFDPRAGEALPPTFQEATEDQVNKALELAKQAAGVLRTLSSERVVALLLAIRSEIEALGDDLVERAAQETALDRERLKGERARTLNQIKLFADVVQEGSWVDARIDPAMLERQPLPRPDIRRMLQPIGPVIVFGASNFPLAFSVAGGDTISALASRNPVVVKAHPAHPGTSEMVALAIAKAVRSQSLHPGVFSLIQSTDPKISIALVKHPHAQAVGFTGSLRAGRALFDAASQRPNPIPVYAEMGSTNPVFILPDALKKDAAKIADGLSKSVMLGTGQFCTCPGLVFCQEGKGFDSLSKTLADTFRNASPSTMLNGPISNGYADKLKAAASTQGVDTILASKSPDKKSSEGQPGLLVTDYKTWARNHILHEEIFGPATLLVRCASREEVLAAGRELDGSLTATIHTTAEELTQYGDLVDELSRIAGRLVVNGYPTGVEVGYAMHHGGPYPATSDAKFTSVGTAAIYRFVKPLCYQNFPDNMLPVELQNSNPRQIMRMINGKLTRESL